VSDQLVSVNNDLSVARRAVEAIVGAYPNGGFGCRLMAPRARYFDALIVEKMFRHQATASISGWDSINGYARKVSRKPYLVALPSAFRRAGCYPPFCSGTSARILLDAIRRRRKRQDAPQDRAWNADDPQTNPNHPAKGAIHDELGQEKPTEPPRRVCLIGDLSGRL
jgi:hypothetical protein